MPTDVELSGKVITKKFGEGSKSDHDAIFLETPDQTIELRKIGGQAYGDTGLDGFVGKLVRVKGILNEDSNMFFARDIQPSE
jgi:hypothetical protein